MTTFLLVPGAGSDPSYWRFLVAELAERGHRGIAVDLPCEDDSADLDTYADAVATQRGQTAFWATDAIVQIVGRLKAYAESGQPQPFFAVGAASHA